jgi:hypothetical protein
VPEPETLLRFDLDLYRREAIEEAITAFTPFASLSLRVDEAVAEVAVAEVAEAHREVLEHEFANFALFQTAVLARGGA